MHLQHSHLDDVSGAALKRRVQRHALGRFAHLAFGSVQVWQVPTTTHDGLGVADRARLGDDRCQVIAHAAKALEVGVHKRFGRTGRDAQLAS